MSAVEKGRRRRQGKDGARARIWEEDLVIPTYEVGPPGRNPDFRLDGWRCIYPYTLRDDLRRDRREVTYRAVYLENEYLKVIVLPELGGHVYSAHDKLAGEEMFYLNRVIKPGRVLLRGAWAAFGLEFNFPRGHSVMTLSTVDSRLFEHDDGSVSVAVGDCEQTQRMRWTVVITLRPGHRRLEINAAVPTDEHLQFLSPARAARRFGEDLPFPYQDGVDKRWYKNHLHATDLFTVDCPYDFFGYYDHGRDFGVAHVADRHILPGKKFFTWGCGGDGLVWKLLLSDEDRAYIEIQAGSHETQGELTLFEPHSSLSWKEYWCPVWQLGPFNYASERVALHLETQVTEGSLGQAVLRVQAFEELPGCTVRLLVDGEELTTWSHDLNPGPALRRTAALPGPWKLLRAEVVDARGALLAHWEVTAEPSPQRPPVRQPTAGGSSAGAQHHQGLRALEQGDEQEAVVHFDNALKRDRHFSPALRDRGMTWLNHGRWEEARKDLEAALSRDPRDALARYYLALALRELGEPERALEEALTAAVRPAYAWLGWQLAGELHLSVGRLVEAEQAFVEVSVRQPGLARSLALLSAARRRQGRTGEASAAARDALDADPLEHLALAELWLLEADDGLFTGTLRAEPQSYVEVASDYLRVGLLDDARRVLEAYLTQLGRRRPYPIVHYYLGYLAERLGDEGAAQRHYKKASALPYDYVFPHRLETERVLRSALLRNPADARAHYYLGNLLAARQRRDEALTAWEEAVKLEPGLAPAHRNIGLVRWTRHRNGRGAVAAYRKAIAAAPDDQDLYWEADGILEEVGHTRARLKLLTSAPPEVIGRDKVAKKLAAAYYALGRYDRLLEVLARYEFSPWEGERLVVQLYGGALAAKARRALDRKQYRAARRYLERSMTYPENFHLGQPSFPRFAKQKVLLAECLVKLGEDEQAHQLLESAAGERYIGWDRGFCEPLYYGGLALLRLGRRGQARKVFQRLCQRTSFYRRRWLHSGLVPFLQGLGHRGLAELDHRHRHLQRSKELLVQALEERADFPEAQAMLEEVKELLARARG